MRAALAARPEILKLARLLHRDPASVAYLEAVDPDDLRRLREQLTDRLFGEHEAIYGRLAAASRLLPIKLIAVIGQRAFGALLAARITGMLDPGRAAEMASTMPVAFLADVAAELDPRRASAVIERIPPERIGLITRELLHRREHVAMGRFVGHLDTRALAAALAQMSDRDILEVAFVLESKDALDELAALLPEERLAGIIDAAARENLWLEALDLLSHLSPERREAIAVEATSRTGPEILEAIVRVAVEEELWLELLPLVEVLPAESQRRAAQEIERLDPRQRSELEAQARAAGMDDVVATLERSLARE